MTLDAATAVAPTSLSLAALQARLASLDSRIRALDPSWVGVMPSEAASGSAVNGTFDSVLAALGASSANTVGALAAPTGAGADVGQPFLQPVAGATLTQPYGPTSLAVEPSATIDGVTYAHFHDGLDLAAPLGTPVRAAADGTVLFAGKTADGAVVVRIQHADGTETRYGHLETALAVKAGDHVTAGQAIGSVGITGNTTGPHLHFELWSGDRTVDPAPFLAAGLLPGSSNGAVSDLSPTAGGANDSGLLTNAALQRFDAVASSIPYAAGIRRAAVAAGIDPLLFASLVSAESGFRADAVSSAGAEGLTQLMPATARSLGVADPFDPSQNLRAGATYLGQDLRLYGRADLALAAYQAGKGAVAAAGGIPNYPSTRSYIATVLGSWSRYLGRSS